jgi:hypothetical protein
MPAPQLTQTGEMNQKADLSPCGTEFERTIAQYSGGRIRSPDGFSAKIGFDPGCNQIGSSRPGCDLPIQAYF